MAELDKEVKIIGGIILVIILFFVWLFRRGGDEQSD